MASLTPVEKKKIKELFDSGGWVLDFTTQSYADFFKSVVGIDIFSARYETYGGSKGKRLTSFLELEPDKIVGKLLTSLLEYWVYLQDSTGKESDTKLSRDIVIIANRLQGKSTPEVKSQNSVEEFLEKSFNELNFQKLPIDTAVLSVLERRYNEAIISQQYGANLATVFLCGSILEGALLGVAARDPKSFNTSKSSPKGKDGQVKAFHDWKLAEFIDVAADIKVLSLDVKKFGHALRDFRNFIHPHEELASGFTPDKHTALICVQVLKAAIASLSGER